METVEGRGICCGNEVYFDYVDGEVVMTMYRDMPGVRMDRRDPNVIKSFSVDQWGEINEYLKETLDDVEGVFRDNGFGEDEVIHEEADLSKMMPGAENSIELPRMSNAEAILPENKVPAMTKDEIQEKFDPITGTQNEEEEKNGKENDEGDSKAETSP